jgi:hypothetical protein
MGHADAPLRAFLKNGQPGGQVGFLRKTLAEQLEKPVVDFANYLEVTGQQVPQ